MGKVTDWALAQIAKLPDIPVPVLLGFFIIAMIAYPTIRKAWKSDVSPPSPPQEAVPMVMMNASGVYTILTNIQLAVDAIDLRVSQIDTKVEMIRRRLSKRKNVTADDE